MIEQVLFTLPGERVNRPDFGCGLLQLVFAPNSDTLAAAIQMTVQRPATMAGRPHRRRRVHVEHDDSTLAVDVQYVVRHGQERRLTRFTRSAP
ncbi:MAG: GPW/gp25 family protein [Dechloromonas sp.]|nr:MAG: GPW/gp25 family protein [Dechloromonas sp.]